MIAILDAAYSDTASAAACVTVEDWTGASALAQFTHRAGPAADYQPGEFYKREMPLLIAVLSMLPRKPEIIVIDGYVWLGAEDRKGLGAHLFEALGGASSVVGIAKTKFHGASYWAAEVRRTVSNSPLYVTAAGVEAGEAAGAVKRMHGEHRIPTLLALADRLARDALRA